MTNRWMKGKFVPINVHKYRGDPNKITYRSSWELNLFRWADTTDEILLWESEKTIIYYTDPVQSKRRKYYVDMKVAAKQADGTVKVILIEIKPHKQTMKPRAGNKSDKTLSGELATWTTNQAKWKAARELCAEKGWTFMILTEKDIFAGVDKGFKPKKKSPRTKS